MDKTTRATLLQIATNAERLANLPQPDDAAVTAFFAQYFPANQLVFGCAAPEGDTLNFALYANRVLGMVLVANNQLKILDKQHQRNVQSVFQFQDAGVNMLERRLVVHARLMVSMTEVLAQQKDILASLAGCLKESFLHATYLTAEKVAEDRFYCEKDYDSLDDLLPQFNAVVLGVATDLGNLDEDLTGIAWCLNQSYVELLEKQKARDALAAAA